MPPAFCSAQDLADHRHDLAKHEPRRLDANQRLAAAALLGECEAIVECGLLPEQNELALRLLIADALAAFEMPSKAERAHDLIKHEADGSIRLVPA